MSLIFIKKCFRELCCLVHQVNALWRACIWWNKLTRSGLKATAPYSELLDFQKWNCYCSQATSLCYYSYGSSKELQQLVYLHLPFFLVSYGKTLFFSYLHAIQWITSTIVYVPTHCSVICHLSYHYSAFVAMGQFGK